VPSAGATGNLALFVALFSVILTMYGGGFATIPAYLSDLFGVGHVSAIHGRLLTAWSTAGILGPVLVNYIREFQIGRGIAPADAYTFTMYILAGFLAIGFLCNIVVRPVPGSLFSKSVSVTGTVPSAPSATAATHPATRKWAVAAVAWFLVCVPLGWGVFKTLDLARQMFR
jgi:hypothetical protein